MVTMPRMLEKFKTQVGHAASKCTYVGVNETGYQGPVLPGPAAGKIAPGMGVFQLPLGNSYTTETHAQLGPFMISLLFK
jgi:hypothetical protein